MDDDDAHDRDHARDHVIMIVHMMVVTRLVKTAGTSAEMITQIAILDIATRRRNALPLDMMMMAFLCKANLILKSKNLCPVFTHGTVHIVAAFQYLADPIGEGRNHLGWSFR